MEQEFALPLIHDGVEMEIIVRIVTWKYRYFLEMTISGIHMIVEPDEAGELRAIVKRSDRSKIEAALLKKVWMVLSELKNDTGP